jgi:hypothetical protein
MAQFGIEDVDTAFEVPVALPPQIPNPNDALSAAVAYLTANKPETVPHLGSGNWANVLQGWRAEMAMTIQRIAQEVKASRLPFATGQDLISLAGSEYDTFVSPDPLTASGYLLVERPVISNMPAGIFRAGFRIRRLATQYPTSTPTLPSATYTVVRDTPVLTGQNIITLLIQADNTGSYANHPNGATGANVQFGDTPFDPNLFIPSGGLGALSMAGGSDGISDPLIRAACKAYFTGRYGPTIGGVTAGALRAVGVAKLFVADDPVLAVTYVVPVDSSWSASLALDQAVAGILNDSPTTPGFAGFGCRVLVGASDPSLQVGFRNVFVSVAITVTLRSANLLASTGPTENNIKAAVLKYFNDRQDWNVFRLQAIESVVAQSDRSIASCTNASVTKVSDGTTVLEPLGGFQAPTANNFQAISHFYLDGSNISITWLQPS